MIYYIILQNSYILHLAKNWVSHCSSEPLFEESMFEESMFEESMFGLITVKCSSFFEDKQT